MKSSYKIFGTLALAAVASSMAMAQDALGYASGYAYAGFYNYAGSGMYITGAGGGYYYYGSYTYGAAGGIDYLGYNIGNPEISSVYGESVAYAQPGGSLSESILETYNWTTITNTSNYYQYEFVYASTSSFSEAYAGSYNAQAVGNSYGWVFDSAGAVDQFSETGAGSFGLGAGGTYAYAYNYDLYNGFSGIYSYFGGSFPNYAYGSAYDAQWYTLIFAPGASDTFYTEGYEYHGAYATTPAPAAIAPFALGLIGALRRRKKA
jgi:MYXO-CTERM domain-containing protein